MGQYARQLKKGKRWYFRGMYKTHKYHSKAIYLKKSECGEAERKYLHKLKKEIKNPRPKFTLLDVCSKRLDYLESKSKGYYGENQRLFKEIIRLWGANTAIAGITRPKINDFLLSEVRRCKKAGQDNYTVNLKIKHLKALFNYAIDELECLGKNPASKLKFYPVKKNVKYIPPFEDIEKVCEVLLPHQRNFYLFCFYTGCRASEALRTTGDDINEEIGLLTLWTRKKKYSDLTPRRINLPDEVIEMYKRDRLFPEWTEYPRFLERACRTVGVKLFGFHAFRHRKASMMAKVGIPINEIQHYLGHESILVTQRYLHLLGHHM